MRAPAGVMRADHRVAADSARRARTGFASRGFTLIELLIALVIMALASGILFGSLRLAARSWDAGEAKLEESATARLAQQFLRTHLSQYHPLRLRNEPERPLFFEGDNDELRFASHLPDRVSAGGIFLLRLAVMDDGRRRNLVLQRAIPDGPVTRESGFDDAQVSTLVADVAAVRLRYFGRESPGQEPRWLDRWNDPQRLPAAVRIDITPRGRPQWPPLVVEHRLSPEAGCPSWNVQQQRCMA